MIKVGLTGNIGSGKSTVARYSKHWAQKFILPMMKPKKLLLQDDVIAQITDLFGSEVIGQHGQIDRKKTCSIGL